MFENLRKQIEAQNARMECWEWARRVRKDILQDVLKADVGWLKRCAHQNPRSSSTKIRM